MLKVYNTFKILNIFFFKYKTIINVLDHITPDFLLNQNITSNSKRKYLMLKEYNKFKILNMLFFSNIKE
jgi:hypothetical protein